MKWLDYALSIVSGIVVCIPLALKLVQYVKEAVQTRQWPKIIELVTQYMASAETLFDVGTVRKAWVLEQIKTIADTVGYSYDETAISELIDSMCAMSKVVNSSESEG